MNKGRFIGGLICVTIAVLLGALNIVLPENNMMFMVDGENMPLVPVIALGVIGIVLLATAWRRGADSEKKEDEIVIDPEKDALNKRLETIAWGLFLVMLGGFFLVPVELVSKGIWSIGVGLIMLGLNAARYFSGLRMKRVYHRARYPFPGERVRRIVRGEYLRGCLVAGHPWGLPDLETLVRQEAVVW